MLAQYELNSTLQHVFINSLMLISLRKYGHILPSTIFIVQKDNSSFLQKLYIFVTSTESPGSSQASWSVAGCQETDSGEQRQILCTKETCKK